MRKLTVLVFVTLFSAGAFAQTTISIGGVFGGGVPQGSAFKAGEGEKAASFGLIYNVDALYHFNEQLAAGITYDGSVLFGAKTGDEGSSLALYGLQLYGVKGYYKFLDKTFSPFAALSLGLSQLSTPTITTTTANGENVQEGVTASGFGIKPEIGLAIGKFVISASYYVPMSYSIGSEKVNAGIIEIGIGFRLPIRF